MVKVVKFGGSSLASAEQFEKVGKIIRADKSRCYVVPSAPGKRNSKDTKVTDMLYNTYALAESDDAFDKELDAIKARYQEIIDGLKLKLSLDKEFEVIRENFKKKAGSDYAASRGEFLNGIIMANYLGYEFIDAAEVIFFDEEGNFMPDHTNEVLSARLSETPKAVVPGFYGAKLDGSVKTFSRGGSDITGSIVAKAAHVDVYENWTDVSGFLVADPRIVENPDVISLITYKELRELSYMGATVLHEDAIFPVREAGIPINIKNTNRPEDAGTMIVSDDHDFDDETCPHTITGIAGRKGFSVINIEKAMMNSEKGFGMKVLKVLYENGISFEHMPSGIDTMSVVVDTSTLESVEDKIIAQLRKEVKPDHLEIEHGIALLAIVGRRMKNTRGTVARLFASLAHARINVKMVDQGSSELNVIVGVNESDLSEAIRRIYDMFVNSEKN